MQPRHIRHKLALWLLWLLTVMAVSSCGSSRKATTAKPGKDSDLPAITEKRKPQQHNGKPEFDVDRKLADRMVSAAKDWIGTPYRFGGQSKDGTDCSGLTMTLYRDIAGVSIPRNSARQCEYCIGIGREDLQPGDLIFFTSNSSGNNVGHVGLYIGEGNMIHASASRGVMTSNIDERYWRLHYHSSGRVNAATYAMTSPGKKPRKPGKKPATPNPEPEPPTAVPVSAEPIFADEPIVKPIIEPIVAEPVAVQPALTGAVITEPAVAETVTTEPAIAEPASDDIPTIEEITSSVENAFN